MGQLRNLHLQGYTPEMCRILKDERLAETSGHSREKGNAGNHIEFIRSIYHQRGKGEHNISLNDLQTALIYCYNMHTENI